jgi:hypothetical protein
VNFGVQELRKGISRLQGISENAHLLCHRLEGISENANMLRHDMQPNALLIWQNFITAKSRCYRVSHFRFVNKTVSIPEDLGHRRGILDASKKIRRKILGCTGLLIGCHTIPLQSDRDHDLVALLGTLGFERECLLFLADVELYDPTCNITRGSGGTQEWPPKNEQYLMTDIHLKYHEVHIYERLPNSHRDIFRNSHSTLERLIRQLQMHGSRDQGIMIQLIIEYLWHDAHACSEIIENLIKLLGAN